MTNNKFQGSERTKVVYVRKENAKEVKNRLKESKFLDDRFRMLPAAEGSDVSVVRNDANAYIAIPVSEEFDQKNASLYDDDELSPESPMILGVGYQECPYSTKMLGNGRANHHQLSKHAGEIDRPAEGYTVIQSVILGIVPSRTKTGLDLDQRIIDRVLQLDSTVCPASRRRQFLEIFGDDRTVVVPPRAFEGEQFISILRDVQRLRNHKCNADDGNNIEHTTSSDAHSDIENLYNDFWRRLALAHDSPRVVRRGGIDPNSKIRESGHRVLWPLSASDESDHTVGPQSPSWIRVTEQGVKQSFDLSKVMFSRGNISEKIRFGKQLVREGDVVLDMYAGIGYYTLPAIIHGKAAKVYACEWNEHAVSALKFNVNDNKIRDKVEIYAGDCRKSAKEHNIVGLVDRVSLGLLPSSEGGWRTAVRALKIPSGGWLHIHGNVPAKEMESWTLWLCSRLSILARDEGKPNDWWILCDHVERVKSFAPTVFHYVADVFVGVPSEASYLEGHKFVDEKRTSLASPEHDNGLEYPCRAWMRRRNGQTWIPALDETVSRPSCALSPDGILSQDWMR
jgi:tRNA G37 N-methylase Trm5